MSSYRSFTIVSAATAKGHLKGKANLDGRYISRTPAGAARKAAGQICRNSRVKGQCTLKITMRETTRGSKGKDYAYVVKRIKDPVTVERDGVEITYNYRTEVKAA
jgi:hypothetical protein